MERCFPLKHAHKHTHLFMNSNPQTHILLRHSHCTSKPSLPASYFVRLCQNDCHIKILVRFRRELRMGGWHPFIEGEAPYPSRPLTLTAGFYTSYFIHGCLNFLLLSHNRSRSRPYKQSDHNCLPIVARVRKRVIFFTICASNTIHIECMCMLSFLHLKFLSDRSVPITTNIDILAQAAQFVGEAHSNSALCMFTHPHTHPLAKTLCMCGDGSHATVA